jgi:hypothetical protein
MVKLDKFHSKDEAIQELRKQLLTKIDKGEDQSVGKYLIFKNKINDCIEREAKFD